MNQTKRNHDRQWIERALKLAQKGLGYVSPNPLVGACLVKANRLVSEGYHARFGAPHAEAEAIGRAGRRAKGAILYITLEPCSSFGKTAPCVDVIIRAGIQRVVIGTIDPNPIHHGKALTLLRRKGIRVTTSVLSDACAKLIEAYAKWIQTRIPFVTLKMAQSLDGKIASRTGESQWITGALAREWVHTLRRSHDAVLVGKNTVVRDDPRLTARNGKAVKEPWRIVLDARGETSPQSRVFRAGGPTILACSEHSFRSAARKFRNTNVTLFPLKLTHGRIDLKALLVRLGEFGLTSILIEGGGEVAGSFLEARLVDKIAWIVAPKIIGGRSAKTSVEGFGIRSLAEARAVKMSAPKSLGEDLLIEGYMEPICFQELSSAKGN
jgi:diaminohydroxyphosphoribosylaminopyrimidine deaminase / 5-amino-6-(5-phosphoribosylamino)uracil reductase